MSLTKEEKKAMKKAYEVEQIAKYILKKSEAESLFEYIDKNIAENGCDHTLKYTEEWLTENFDDEEKIAMVIEELEEEGGYCDCEVVMNCYEQYELEF